MLLFFAACMALPFFCVLVSAQEAPQAASAETALPVAKTETMEAVESASPDEAEPPSEETRWLWAEVVSVEPAAGQFNVRYLSYDTDEEKEMIMVIDKDTKLENLSSLSEMEEADSVSVDYVVDKNGKATAKSISLQKAKSTVVVPPKEQPVETAVNAVSEGAPAPEMPVMGAVNAEAADKETGPAPADAPAIPEAVNAQAANTEAAGQ